MGSPGTYAYSPPATLPNIVTQSASLSAKTVTPGTPITVTADITNKGAVNGSKKVTVYVNGQEETSQGLTVNSGGSTKLTFKVSRSEPGDYNVYVDGVPAGSFKVEMLRESDTITHFQRRGAGNGVHPGHGHALAQAAALLLSINPIFCL